MKDKGSIFTGRSAVALGLLCTLMWSAAFPLIKVGMAEYAIAEGDTAAKMLFAGVRFFLAGAAVCLFAMKKGERLAPESPGKMLHTVLFGLINTGVHYMCFYIGLSNSTGSRASIIEAMSTFILITLSCAFFTDDRFDTMTILGCILGIAGIVVINAGSGSGRFTFSGDGVMLLSAVSSAAGGLYTRKALSGTSPYTATGISMLTGGAALALAGVLLGGRLTVLTPKGAVIMLALVSISAAAFGIYNKLLTCNPVSRIAICNSLIPLMSVVLCCVFLGEAFDIRYIISGILVCSGMTAVNARR